MEDLLREPGTVPSQSVMQRNRLTVLMGFCAIHQDISADILQAPGGAITVASQGLSPSIGYEWMLHCFVSVKVENLSDIYNISQRLGVEPVEDSMLMTTVLGARSAQRSFI